MRLQGKVALISGGARGIGEATARLFVQEGAKVVMADLLEAEGRKLSDELNKTGKNALYIKMDVTKEEDWAKAVKAATDQFGKLNVLILNAGITSQGRIDQITRSDWDKVMDVNSTGVFLGARAGLPAIKRAGGGSVIITSSQLGLVGGDASHAAYQASKGAVRLLAKNIAIQFAADNIRCNSIHPGPIETPMTAHRRADPAFLNRLMSKVPMGRIGQPMEIAYGMLYLASEESSYVTGSELVIDGGWTAQ
ncbi:MAG: glucose 1-dehydrogenase [SAR202 cluster bacterium]|nr:glucose 1-dehydrogenase [SAR202 cluster bacterium]